MYAKKDSGGDCRGLYGTLYVLTFCTLFGSIVFYCVCMYLIIVDGCLHILIVLVSIHMHRLYIDTCLCHSCLFILYV